MKFTSNKKFTSWLLCMMLIVAMALTAGCGEKKQENTSSAGHETVTSKLGEGKTQFNFIVVDKDGKETAFDIHTDKTTVGDALLELGLIEGEEGAYGLFVKQVNGIIADYDVDKTYWAFYVNGEYALKGVDLTEITEGETYSFKVQK